MADCVSPKTQVDEKAEGKTQPRLLPEFINIFLKVVNKLSLRPVCLTLPDASRELRCPEKSNRGVPGLPGTGLPNGFAWGLPPMAPS